MDMVVARAYRACMKHLKFSDKTLLVDDDTADALVRYATLLAIGGTADNVDVRAFGADGDEVVASMMLSEGASIIAETTHSSLPAPDNTALLDYLRERIELMENPPQAVTEDVGATGGVVGFEY